MHAHLYSGLYSRHDFDLRRLEQYEAWKKDMDEAWLTLTDEKKMNPMAVQRALCGCLFMYNHLWILPEAYSALPEQFGAEIGSLLQHYVYTLARMQHLYNPRLSLEQVQEITVQGVSLLEKDEV